MGDRCGRVAYLPRQPADWAVLTKEKAVVHAYYTLNSDDRAYPLCKRKRGSIVPFTGEPFLYSDLMQAYFVSIKFCASRRGWFTASTLSAVERVFGS